jgi:rRNA-processing protein EBP2
MFDVAVEDEIKGSKKDKRDGDRSGKRGDKRGGENKRQKRDSKFGFGGKKRFGKSNDATSSGDLTGVSAKRMKSKFGSKKTARPGKSKRAKV